MSLKLIRKVFIDLFWRRCCHFFGCHPDNKKILRLHKNRSNEPYIGATSNEQHNNRMVQTIEKQKCTLEDFFAEDDDIPDFYMCNTFTDVIFKVPAMLNGRIYEKSEILHWIRKEGKSVTRSLYSS